MAPFTLLFPSILDVCGSNYANGHLFLDIQTCGVAPPYELPIYNYYVYTWFLQCTLTSLSRELLS